jgi:hypothetical protein
MRHARENGATIGRKAAYGQQHSQRKCCRKPLHPGVRRHGSSPSESTGSSRQVRIPETIHRHTPLDARRSISPFKAISQADEEAIPDDPVWDESTTGRLMNASRYTKLGWPRRLRRAAQPSTPSVPPIRRQKAQAPSSGPGSSKYP